MTTIGRVADTPAIPAASNDLRWLFDRYYGTERSSGPETSSHWTACSKQVEVRLDANGCPVPVRGHGFGELRFPRPWQAALDWVTIGAYLARLPDRARMIPLLRPGPRLARRMGLAFTYDAFRQVCTLALIAGHLSETQHRGGLRVLLIGDGYGFLGALVKEVYPQAAVVFVDLGQVLLFQAHYVQRAHPGCRHRVAGAGRAEPLADSDFVYCPADRLEALPRLSCDVAVNIASMQEMTTEAVTSYLRFLREHLATEGLFYCCNRERKRLTGGEVQEFARYPWSERDVRLVDGACPWHRYYLGFRRASNGPRIFGWRVPFVNCFDGPHRHRLTRLARG